MIKLTIKKEYEKAKKPAAKKIFFFADTEKAASFINELKKELYKNAARAFGLCVDEEKTAGDLITLKYTPVIALYRALIVEIKKEVMA